MLDFRQWELAVGNPVNILITRDCYVEYIYLNIYINIIRDRSILVYIYIVILMEDSEWISNYHYDR